MLHVNFWKCWKKCRAYASSDSQRSTKTEQTKRRYFIAYTGQAKNDGTLKQGNIQIVTDVSMTTYNNIRDIAQSIAEYSDFAVVIITYFTQLDDE